MSAMTPAELDAFLDRPLVATFSTNGADGAPRVMPVWFQYDGRRFYVWTDLESVKLRNAQRDPRIALCIATHDEPYRYVVVRGRAEIQSDGVVDRASAIARRYYGPQRGEQYGRSAEDGKSVILAITPDAILSEASA